MLTRAEIVGFAALEQESNAVRPKILSLVALLYAGSCAPQAPGPGRLLLSNPDFPLINVEAVITANADCDARDDGYVSTLEFAMPNNATKFIDVPPGDEICWRRDRDPSQPVSGQWSGWDRAYVEPGTTIDANL